jgi:phosphatidylinositol alpha-1,6-mannosyltransferase
MKKLLITLDFPPEAGGIQRYLHEIVLHTFHDGDMVLTTGDPRQTMVLDAAYPCRIIRITFPLLRNNKKLVLIPMLLALLQIVSKEKTAITVIGGNIYAGLLPFFISTFFPVAYTVYCYGTELMPFLKYRSPKTFVFKKVLRGAETISYLTDATKKLLIGCIGDGPYVQNVPKIDLPDFFITDKHRDSGTIRLLSVGRLVPHKGHAFLIEAVRRINSGISWQLTIVGNGPEYRHLSAIIRDYTLEQNVAIQTDAIDRELSLLYGESDIFVFPSIETDTAIEGFGIVLLEAMSYGVAIIASRSGGIPAVFENADECALLIPPGNPEALCEAITVLALDIPRRQRMVRNARYLLERRYVWK